MSHALARGFMATPPLWRRQQFGLQQFEFPDVNVSLLPPADNFEHLRLGHQMEIVFKELIAASKQYTTLAANILIDEGKIRLGELDFVLQHTASGQVLHIELAYKFYLIDPKISEPIYRLVGPNRRDMFYTKLDKLKDKQFPLLYHSSLANLWEALEISILKVTQQCCFKAQLFEPLTATSIRPLNTDCIMGKWLPFPTFESKQFSKNTYYLPLKKEWPLTPKDAVPWMGHTEALMEINLRMLKRSSPMLWVRFPDGTLEKWFVVWW